MFTTQVLNIKDRVLFAQTLTPHYGFGHDISWPQCNELHKLPKKVDFGIVGITGGSAYTQNPCLEEEYKWAQTTESISVYMNLNIGGDDDREKGLHGPYGNCKDADLNCQVSNYGYNAALDAYAYARSKKVINEKMWWLDIEDLNPWSDDPMVNRKIIDGAVRFFKEKGVPIGIYSTPILWHDITADYKNNLPAWPAIITESPAQECGTGFTGGKTYAVQYYQIDLDKNFACG